MLGYSRADGDTWTRKCRHFFQARDDLIQYMLLITIPVFVLNKTVQSMMPKYDERNGNIELLGEVLLSSVCLLLGIYIAHRVIIYLPTFSGNSLAELNFMNVALLIGFCMMYSENGKKIYLNKYDRNGSNPKQ